MVTAPNFKESYNTVEEFYNLLQKATTTGQREEYYSKIKKEIKNCPMLNNYWEIVPHERLYRNRVVRIKVTITEEIMSSSVYVDGKKRLQDGIDYSTPSRGGLYFLGETHFNPFTKEEFYWVKIGKATNFEDRLRSYNTCNPMCYRIDFKRGAEKQEKAYQALLFLHATARCNHNSEWFLVNRNTYLEMCEKGFAYFD